MIDTCHKRQNLVDRKTKSSSRKYLGITTIQRQSPQPIEIHILTSLDEEKYEICLEMGFKK